MQNKTLQPNTMQDQEYQNCKGHSIYSPPIIEAGVTGLSGHGSRTIKKLIANVPILAAKREHGDRFRYIAGCRCDDCRHANATYESSRRQARKEGDWNGLVSTVKARKHLLKLAKQGVGRCAVEATTDISSSILCDIRYGKKSKIRARTERKILAVTSDMVSEHALVSANSTWALINKIIENGYTKTQIAQLLGYRSKNNMPALRIGKRMVTARTALSIIRLYKKLKERDFADAKDKDKTKTKICIPGKELPAGIYRPEPGVLIHIMA